jgi:serine/threonine protein kinase
VRTEIEQAARREWQFALGIGPQGEGHPGIDAPLDYLDSSYGPALIFNYDPTAVPLEDFMREHGAGLTILDRLRLIRSIAEVIKYAHARSIVHRALTPRNVYVAERDGVRSVRIRDWMLGRKTSAATTSITLISRGVSEVDGGVDAGYWPFLAPETVRRAKDAPPTPLDVFGLGSTAYLVLTGKAPARTGDLERVYRDQAGFNPQAVVPELNDFVATVVEDATRFTESERTATVEQFLENLAAAEAELVESAEQPIEVPTLDPLEASAGQSIGAGRFTVIARRGSGSTGTAILVDDASREGAKAAILKLARDDTAAARLKVEAEALADLDHPRVVRMIQGPIDVDGRTAILMTDAGRSTLSERMQSEGRSTLEQLQNYGADVLEAVAYLDSIGVFHRDIKPANIAIGQDPGTRKPRANLFDFSLSREPLQKIESGSHPYLDPFLGRGARRQYDRAAELYAVSVTLFEMATAQKPWWREGEGAPTGLDDRAVIIAGQFETVVAADLCVFFVKALAPDVADRFGNIADMRVAWAEIFARVQADGEAGDATEDARRVLADQATLDTLLAQSGLTAHAQSGLARIRVLTVGDVIARSPVDINVIAGLGERTRKEIARLRRAWLERLGGSTTVTPEITLIGDESVERRVRRLVPQAAGDPTPEQAVLGALLNFDEHPDAQQGNNARGGWRSVAEVATLTGLTVDLAREIVDAAVKRWRKSGLLAPVVGELESALESRGGVATTAELASAVLLRYGSGWEGSRRQAIALGLVRAVIELDATAQVPMLAASRPAGAEAVLIALSVDTRRVTQTPPEQLISVTRAAAAAIDSALAERAAVPAALMRVQIRTAAPDAKFDDRRLLELAARASARAELSSADEVYRRDITAAEATELAMRGVLAIDLTVEVIARRVKRRFAALAETLDRPELDAIVATTQPHLHWNGASYSTTDSTSSATASTQLGALAITPAHELSAALERSLQRHSALTIAVHPKRYAEATRALQQRFGIDVVDVSTEVAARLHEVAEAKRARWATVAEADSDPASTDFQRLKALAREALEPWWRELMDEARPLLIIHAAPLARYGLESLLAELTDLGATRSAARWLLVPQNPALAAPDLDGRPVPMGPDRWVTLPTTMAELTMTGDAA